MSSGILLRGLALFSSLVVVGFVLKSTGLGAVFDEAWIDAYVRGRGLTPIIDPRWVLSTEKRAVALAQRWGS